MGEESLLRRIRNLESGNKFVTPKDEGDIIWVAIHTLCKEYGWTVEYVKNLSFPIFLRLLRLIGEGGRQEKEMYDNTNNKGVKKWGRM